MPALEYICTNSQDQVYSSSRLKVFDFPQSCSRKQSYIILGLSSFESRNGAWHHDTSLSLQIGFNISTRKFTTSGEVDTDEFTLKIGNLLYFFQFCINDDLQNGRL